MWKFHRFYREQRTQSDEEAWTNWTLKSSLKTILEQATIYFYYKTGIFEYSKREIAILFAEHFPNFAYLSSLMLAAYLWHNYPDDADSELQLQIAEQARRFENHVTLALGFGEEYVIR